VGDELLTIGAFARRSRLSPKARQARQRSLVEHLRSTLSGGKDTNPMFTIETRDVDDQLVLTEQIHVTADRLTEWIREAGTRAWNAVGQASGPAMIIYHGEVSEDSDGPVESAYPVTAEQAASTDLPTRVEPAHREAYARIPKSLVRFPDILSAYDAVETWIAQNGEQQTGSPREVYFADFMEAGDDDLVCDIAFPIA
jgi:effector-binding domain-containing protein